MTTVISGLSRTHRKLQNEPKLAREGHEVRGSFDSPGGLYTDRLLMDGEVYSHVGCYEEVSET
jgi:hypothetical protein